MFALPQENDELNLLALLTALGLGLLIGVVRERRKRDGKLVVAGLRTHALAALLGVIALWLGPALLTVAVLLVGLFALFSYRYTAEQDPGLTSEMTLVLTVLLGGLALRQPAVAAGLGVVAAILLESRESLHRLTREVLSEREVHDGLILLASALVVLPLLPAEAIDPWGALRLALLWRVVVLVMAVGVLGHICLRLVGVRWGLPLAGFFSGFVSSTAAVIGFGHKARENPGLGRFAVAASLFANLASVLLMMAIVGSLSPALLGAAAPALAGAAGVLLVGGLLGLGAGLGLPDQLPTEPPGRSFRIGHALLLALAIGVVMALSTLAQHWFGGRGVLTVATLAALVEWHAASASLAQMQSTGDLAMAQARWGLVLLLAASTVMKSALAMASGGLGHGLRIAIGLGLATVVAGFLTL